MFQVLYLFDILKFLPDINKTTALHFNQDMEILMYMSVVASTRRKYLAFFRAHLILRAKWIGQMFCWWSWDRRKSWLNEQFCSQAKLEFNTWDHLNIVPWMCMDVYSMKSINLGIHPSLLWKYTLSFLLPSPPRGLLLLVLTVSLWTSLLTYNQHSEALPQTLANCLSLKGPLCSPRTSVVHTWWNVWRKHFLF